MKYRTPCPACDGTVGFWSVFAAVSPWNIKCSTCKRRLVLGWTPTLAALVVLEIVAGAAAGIAGGLAAANGMQLWYPFLLALAAAGLIDAFVSLLVMNKGLLRLPK